MNNTEKLLRAFIEASGYKVEETKTMSDLVTPSKSKGESFLEYKYEIIDYKVTKKPESDIELTTQLVMGVIELSKLEKTFRWIMMPKTDFDIVIRWFGSAAKKQSDDHYYIYDVSVELLNEKI